ncbi:MAG: alpha-galactosidase [Spirochaetes bacterium]|nr:alpha-galactosidase [Spirochaetota bacterium]MBU0957075.1 alpha-galactosidase [Spirochaetota bacterium]
MWMTQWQGTVEYQDGYQQKQIQFDEHGCRTDGKAENQLRLELKTVSGGSILRLLCAFERPVQLTSLRIDAGYKFVGGNTVFLNGYQSWTDSREFDARTVLSPPSSSPLLRKKLAPHRLNRYGDYDFVQYAKKSGRFHGWSYGYIRSSEKNFCLVGSLDERSGFTLLKADMYSGRLSIEKDLAGSAAAGEGCLLSLFFAEADYDTVFDCYFRELNIQPPAAKPTTGWTSWYNYYQNISEKIILKNLDAFASRKIPIEVFQIDDGFQTAVGDWLSIQDKFPSGMGHIARRISEAGYTPGLWLAPFVCETKSRLFSEHKDWIVRDGDGQLVDAGGNWSGFYCLNLELPAVRDYLRTVFRTVLDDWGFKLVKLDFLYAACIQPHSGKTRGQLMCEAMDFLREIVGDKKILGCGVPLWPAFGKVEYCRIGTDVDLQWDNKLYRMVAHRERPSTANSIGNAIGRRHLDKRAFINDPDVFLLRHDNIKLNAVQKRTLFAVNALFGNLLFTSDDLELYSDSEYRQYLGLFPFLQKRIGQVDCVKDFYKADFEIAGARYRLFANCSYERRFFSAPEPLFCLRDGKPLWLPSGQAVILNPYETLIGRCDAAAQELWPLGSTSSLFPASEASSWQWLPSEQTGQSARLELEWQQPVLQKGILYLKVPAGVKQFEYNGTVIYTSPVPVAGISGQLAALEFGS